MLAPHGRCEHTSRDDTTTTTATQTNTSTQLATGLPLLSSPSSLPTQYPQILLATVRLPCWAYFKDNFFYQIYFDICFLLIDYHNLCVYLLYIYVFWVAIVRF